MGRVILIYTILLLLVIPQTIADTCPNLVRPINKGEQTECSGFLFSDEAEKKAAKFRDDTKFYEQLVPQYEKKMEAQDRLIETQERHINYYKEVTKEQSGHDFEKYIYFVLGGVVMYGAYQLAK